MRTQLQRSKQSQQLGKVGPYGQAGLRVLDGANDFPLMRPDRRASQSQCFRFDCEIQYKGAKP